MRYGFCLKVRFSIILYSVNNHYKMYGQQMSVGLRLTLLYFIFALAL